MTINYWNYLNDDCISVVASYADVKTLTLLSRCSKRLFTCLHLYLTSVVCTTHEQLVGRDVLLGWFSPPHHRPVSTITNIVLSSLPTSNQWPSFYSQLGQLLSDGTLRRLERFLVSSSGGDGSIVEARQGNDMLSQLAIAAERKFCLNLETVSISLGSVADFFDVSVMFKTIADNCPVLASVSGESFLTPQFLDIEWPHLEELDVCNALIPIPVEDDEDDHLSMLMMLEKLTVSKFPSLVRLLFDRIATSELFDLLIVLAVLLSYVDRSQYVFDRVTHLSLYYHSVYLNSFGQATMADWKQFSQIVSLRQEELQAQGRLGSILIAERGRSSGERCLPSFSSYSSLPILFPNCRYLYCYHWLPSVEFMFLIGNGCGSGSYIMDKPLTSAHSQPLSGLTPGLHLVMTVESDNPALQTFLSQFTELCVNSNAAVRFDPFIGDTSSDSAAHECRWNISSMILLHRAPKFACDEQEGWLNYAPPVSRSFGVRRVPSCIVGSAAYNGTERPTLSCPEFVDSFVPFDSMCDDADFESQTLFGCLVWQNGPLIDCLHSAMRQEPQFAFRHVRTLLLGLEFFLRYQPARATELSLNARISQSWGSLSHCISLEKLTVVCMHRSGEHTGDAGRAVHPLCKVVAILVQRLCDALSCPLPHRRLRSLSAVDIVFAAQEPLDDVFQDLQSCAGIITANHNERTPSCNGDRLGSCGLNCLRVRLLSQRPHTAGVRCISALRVCKSCL